MVYYTENLSLYNYSCCPAKCPQGPTDQDLNLGLTGSLLFAGALTAKHHLAPIALVKLMGTTWRIKNWKRWAIHFFIKVSKLIITKFFDSFRKCKSANSLGVPVRKSQIHKFFMINPQIFMITFGSTKKKEGCFGLKQSQKNSASHKF